MEGMGKTMLSTLRDEKIKSTIQKRKKTSKIIKKWSGKTCVRQYQDFKANELETEN